MRVLQFILLGLLICSCSSEDSFANITNPNPEQLSDGKGFGKLLRTVQSNQFITKYQYNSDSTLYSVKEEWNGKIRNESKLIYKNGKVSEIIYQDVFEDSEIKRIFEYNGDLLVKESMYRENEVLNIHEYFYGENNRMVKQIQKLELDNEATKQTRVIDIHKLPGKNEIQLTFNGTLSFILTHDDTANPHSNIKGYSIIHASHSYGISNNIISFKRITNNGEDTTETTELTFDSSGEYLLETTKTGNNQKLICKEYYTYN